MRAGRTLEAILAKINVSPTIAGLASIPATFSSFYLLTNSSLSSISGTLLAPVLSGLAAFGISNIIARYLSEKRALRELGIEERELKVLDEIVSTEPEKERNLVQRVCDYFLLHPKLSGLALGVAFTAYASIEAGIGGYASRHLADGTFVRFLLKAIAYNTISTAVFGYLGYLGVNYLSHMASSYDASTFFKLFPTLFASNRTRIKALSELIGKKPSRFLRLSLTELLMKEKELDSACEQAKDALSSPDKPLLLTQKISDTIKPELAAAYDRFKKGKGDIASGIFVAWCCNGVGHTETADAILRQMTGAANSAEASALAALWLGEAFGRKNEATAYWQDSALRLILDDSAIVLPVGEGVNRVYTIGGTFLRNLLIFKEQPFESIEQERRVLAYVTALPKDALYTQPKELAALTCQKDVPKHVLVLQYMRGETLLEKARKKAVSYEDLLRIVDYASLLHRELPLSLSSAGPVDLKDKLESIVNNPFFGLNEDLKRRLKLHAEFLAEDLKGFDVIALDPHAGNWLFGDDGGISKLDHSAVRDSLFRDLAKLFTHPELQVSGDYLYSLQGEGFKRYSGLSFINIVETDFRRLHLEGMFLQALSLASAWSIPQMKHNRGKRAAALADATATFDMLKQNHPEHYGFRKLIYDALESDFMRAREIIAAQN